MDKGWLEEIPNQSSFLEGADQAAKLLRDELQSALEQMAECQQALMREKRRVHFLMMFFRKVQIVIRGLDEKSWDIILHVAALKQRMYETAYQLAQLDMGTPKDLLTEVHQSVVED